MSDRRFSFSLAGTESKRGDHALKRTNYSPIPQTPQGTTTISPELPRDVFPSTNWPVDTSVQTQGFASGAPFDSSPLLLPPTFHESPISSQASGNSHLHFGYDASSRVHHSIVEQHPQAVAMPTLTGRYGGGLIDAHACYYGPSSGFANDDYMAGRSRAVPSPTITMPIFPTYLRTGAPSYANPLLPSDPALRWSPRYRTTTSKYVKTPGPSLCPRPPGSFYSSSFFNSPSSSPLSPDNHNLVTVPFDNTSNHIQPRPVTAASVDPLYTLRVRLESIKLPSTPSAGDLSFFRCHWEDCNEWITSEKEAVKNHLTRAHGVDLKGKPDDSASCKWAGCSSSLQKCGLVRHFQTHLGLQWLCSVCKGSYTRPDSVRSHAERERRCKLAKAISHPSPLAYRVTDINGDGIVILTKILQP